MRMLWLQDVAGIMANERDHCRANDSIGTSHSFTGQGT